MKPLPGRLPTASVEPEAEIVTPVVLQADDPPATAGAVGPALSRLAVLAALPVAVVHAEALPALSTDRACTMVVVVPLAWTVGDAIATKGPPLVEAWY